MTRRRPTIERKKPAFFGCEGESESAYGQVLSDILRALGRPVHLHVELLAPGAGDPLARLQKALQRITEHEKRREKFRWKAILMDSDQAAMEPERAAEATRLAAQHHVRIIWQDPCHEALLLRHLPGCSDRRPPASAVALTALRQVWPDYEKPMARAQLATRIDHDAIRRAADVEPDLRGFLVEIGLLP